jgi:hypothetical protein
MIKNSPSSPDTKTCSQCRQTKPLGAYYRHPTGQGGRDAQCKECKSGWMRQHRASNATGRPRHRPRGVRDARDPSPFVLLQRAQQTVKRALRRGVLERPPTCQECNEPCHAQAHYPDVTRPLQGLRWLCQHCATEWKKARRG